MVIKTRETTLHQSIDDDVAANKNRSSSSPAVIRQPTKRFYIDELGFYRHLDPEQRQYVCSNINGPNLRATSKKYSPTIGTNNSIGGNINNNGNTTSNNTNEADGGYEICFKAIRRDLGISHFDRMEDYDSWKRGWDEFMRAKLTSQQPVTLNRELKSRVRSGIPHDYRCKVWSALIRMRTRSIRATFGENIYDVIVADFVSKLAVPDYNLSTTTSTSPSSSLSPSPDSSLTGGDANNNNNNNSNHNSKLKNQHNYERHKTNYVNSNGHNNNNNNTYVSQRPFAQEPTIDKCFKQIELDLLRTLPNNRHFEDPNSRGIQRVRRVLRAYACFNQAVGYCQGMNRLAAMALLVLPEEEAFWCLVAIIQCIMPKDYYLKPWLAQVDCCVLGDLLEKKMPKLHKHLVNNDIQLTLFTWFFTIFVDGFRPELMLRIWDCFLLEGDKVLFRFALAILYLSQDELLEMNDFSAMSSHLSRLASTRKLDMEHLFETFNRMNPLSSGTLQARREFHRNRMQSMLDD